MAVRYPKHINLKIDEQSFSSLTSVADEEGFCVNAIIRHLIKRYLRERSVLNGKYSD